MTVSVLFGQTPKLVVQTNVFAPLLKPVTPDVPIVGVVTVDVPVNIDQVPKPIAGFTPFKLAVGVQTV